MKKACRIILVCLFSLTATTAPAFAAANPINLPNSAVTAPGSAPAEYLQTIKAMRENKFGENEVKSFVYQVFNLLDRHVDIKQLMFLFSEEELMMTVPEGPINSQQDFDAWYANLGTKYQSNFHVVEKVSVQIPRKGDYQVSAIVLWQALGRDGKFTSQRQSHQWKVVDGGGYFPRITSFIVEVTQ